MTQLQVDRMKRIKKCVVDKHLKLNEEKPHVLDCTEAGLPSAAKCGNCHHSDHPQCNGTAVLCLTANSPGVLKGGKETMVDDVPLLARNWNHATRPHYAKLHIERSSSLNLAH